MKLQGKITNWNDSKGFGFVEPTGGGQKAFVHIKTFLPRTRRPNNGEVISYELEVDYNKRYRATKIKFQNVSKSANVTRKPKVKSLFAMAITCIFCVALVLTVLAERLPVIVAGLYLLMSFAAFIAYAIDKTAAQNGTWRTQESTLHFLALAGGWPGALFAQNSLRHKSSKAEFKGMFWVTVVLNLGGLLYLLSDKGAHFLNNITSL